MMDLSRDRHLPTNEGAHVFTAYINDRNCEHEWHRTGERFVTMNPYWTERCDKCGSSRETQDATAMWFENGQWVFPHKTISDQAK